MKIICLFFFLMAPLLAQETKALNGYDPRVDEISDNYEAGPYLIYDCQAGHWVCVLAPYYLSCQQQREKDLKSGSLSLSCAPMGEFLNKKSCFQQQLFLVGQAQGNRFCISDSWKQKELKTQ